MVVPELPHQMPDTEVSNYDDWRADFHTVFHALDPVASFEDCLQPEPVPQCYAVSQLFAKRLLNERSNGVLYPSVRHPGGTCIVCFRPPLVYRPRQAARYEIELTLTGNTYKTKSRSVPIEA